MDGEGKPADVMTGTQAQTPPGQQGFPSEGSRPPADQHHEDVPRGVLALGLRGALRESAGYGPAGAASDQLWSVLAYPGVVLIVPALAVYLAKRRESPFVRWHAAQALNLCITAFLYTLSCVILGGLLSLDTTAAALAVAIPLGCVVWISAVTYAVAGGVAARRGRQRQLPGWICSPMVK